MAEARRPARQTLVVLPVPGVRVQSGVTYTIFGYGLLQGQPAFRVQAVVDAAADTALPRSGGGGLTATDPLCESLAVGASGLTGLAYFLTRRRRATW